MIHTYPSRVTARCVESERINSRIVTRSTIFPRDFFIDRSQIHPECEFIQESFFSRAFHHLTII